LGVAVDAGHFHPVGTDERARLRGERDLNDARTLVCVGRLAWQKGQDQLVAKWEEAPPPSTELVLVGPGDTTELEAAAPTQWGKSIRWVGEQDDVRPWVWSADVLVMPSRYEGVPVVIGEAMACGVPVVATAFNGTREALLDPPGDPCGAVVPLGDMAALLREAQRRLDSADLIAAEAMAGPQRAAQLYEPVLVADRLEAAYLEAIASRHPVKGS
jgi:glycosyltransferase involved in cell wall biosynthesis